MTDAPQDALVLRLDIAHSDIVMLYAGTTEVETAMKVRTMVYLEKDQLRALKAEARDEGISLAELIRRGVRSHLDRRKGHTPPPREVFFRIVALGQGGRGDVSERHDAYLGGIR